MKKSCLFLLMTTLVAFSLAYAEFSTNTVDECGVYVQKLERERNRLDNFEDEVFTPMLKEMSRLKKTVSHRINRPREIESKISKLENGIIKLEIDIKTNVNKIDLLTKEAETDEAQGKQAGARKKRKKCGELERQNIKKTSKIERDSGKIDDLKEEAEEIRTSQPPLPRLEEELAQLETQLEDQEQMKRHLKENVIFYENTLGMCRDYIQLRIECGRN